jgi:hypothetical protein
MPIIARFALARKPTDPNDKPVLLASLADLVATIHRDRKGGGLQAFDAEIHVFGEAEPRQGVSLFAIDDGEQSRFLGWAFLEGRGVHALRRALDVANPDVPVIGKAA